MQEEIDANENAESIINIAKSYADSENYERVILTLSSIILITILTQDKIIVKMVITPETLLTN
jgi:hypothetical protein